MGMTKIERRQMAFGTAAEWTAVNPTLAQGEFGFETDTRKRKVGNGVTAWNSLAYDTDTIITEAGSVAYPAVAIKQSNKGLFSSGTDKVAMSIAGTKRMEWTNSGVDLTGTLTTTSSVSGVATFTKSGGQSAYLYADATYVGFGGSSGLTGNQVYIDNVNHAVVVQTGAGGGAGRMRVDASGMAVNYSGTLAAQIHVSHATNSAYVQRLQHTGTSPLGLSIYYSGAAPNNAGSAFLVCEDNVTSCFTIWSNGTTSGRSDAKWKKNIILARDYLDDLCDDNVRPRKYEWIDSVDGVPELGWVADYVERKFPGLVVLVPDHAERQLILGGVPQFEKKHFPAMELDGEILPAIDVDDTDKPIMERYETGTFTKMLKKEVILPMIHTAVYSLKCKYEALEQRLTALEGK